MANQTLGTIRGTIEIDYNGAGIIRAKDDLDDLKDKGLTNQQVADKTAKAFAIAGGVIAGGFAVAAKSAADFDKQMSAVAAVSGATEDELEKLRQKALQLGKDTAFSASESALAMEELVKAGLSVEEVLNGAADATVALAAAGGVDLPQAAMIASNAMNQFNLSAKDLPRVADLIAGAANASAIDVGDFGMSLAQVGAVANLAGQSFEETATAIALMGNAGIKGSDAGTSLKTFLSNLIPTTKKQTDLMKELGLITQTGGNAFVDAAGKMRSLSEISQILQNHLEDLTPTQRQVALETLFGSDAIRAAAILTKAGADGFAELNKEMTKTTAAEVAAKRLDNTAGKLEQLKGSAETLGIIIGSALIPAINAIIVKVTSLLEWFIELDDTWRNVILIFAGSVGTFLLVTAGIIKMVKAIETISATLKVIKSWTIATKVAAAATKAWAIANRLLSISLLGTPLGLIILAIAALAAGFIILFKRSEKFRKFWKAVWAGVLTVIRPIIDFFKGPFIDGFMTVFNWLKRNWPVLLSILAGPFAPFVALIIIFRKQIWDAIQAMWNVIVDIGKAMVKPFLAVWEVIGPAVKAVFDLVIAIITTAWTIISALFTVALTVLKAIFIPVWNLFASTVKAVFDLIIAVITAAWNFIQPYIQAALSALQSVWNAVWGVIKAVTVEVWNAISAVIRAVIDFVRPYVETGVNAIKAVISAGWNAVKTTTTVAWNIVKAVFTTVWNFLVTLVRAAVNSVVAIVGNLKKMVDGVKQWFNGLKKAAQGGTGELLAYVGTIPKAILKALGNLGKILYNAGKAIIQGLINGIKNMTGPVKDAVKGVLKSARNLLPFSPAKEGPFSGRGWTTYSGASMMEGLAEGIESARRMPVDALLGALGTVAVNVPPAVSSGASGGSARPLSVAGRTVTIGQLNVRGVWDFTNPASTRQMVSVLHQELDRYEKEHV